MINTTPCQPIGNDDGRSVSTKKCSKCGEVKPLDDFCVDKSTRSGRKSRCRPCVAEDKKLWAINNPEKRRDWHAAWTAKNPDKRKAGELRFREGHREMLAIQAAEYRKLHPNEAIEYRARNKERLQEWARDWRNRNQDKVRAAQERRALRFTELDRKRAAAATREWCRNNPGKTSMQRFAARARGPVDLTAVRETELEDIGQIYAEAMMLSEETGQRMVVDHVFPLNGATVSGLHVAANLRIVTNSVNSRKSKFLPGVMAEYLWDPAGDDVYYDGDPPRKKKKYAR